MSIRNATIAMRQRKIGLFEQERAVSGNGKSKRRGVAAVRSEKKSSARPKQKAWASWREH